MPGAVAPLDPSDCGPAFLALPQDIQAEAYDFPAVFFEPRVHYIRRPAPDPRGIEAAAAVLREASKPMIISGGGVHYSDAVEQLTDFAESHGIPVVETVARTMAPEATASSAAVGSGTKVQSGPSVGSTSPGGTEPRPTTTCRRSGMPIRP